ncbi:hypothetical protein [Nocardia australiensis]|uniref:hypothetical protein n=1 Tax=Nocardia australiensis TaxID=2887191 RepID=UPI001D14C81C|nr:hypothetical protein [Nocardia australiensis]
MSQDSSIRISDATDQDARICLDRFAGRAYAAQSLRADLYRFTVVILTNTTEIE